MSHAFDRVVHIMAALRAPDGCPWDRKQTHASLKPYLLEETYEVLETIDHGDARKLKEELGDVLLQVLFHSQIASEQGTFTIEEVLDHLSEKLVRRHPHVFDRASTHGADGTMNSDQVLHRWEEIKRAEREAAGYRGSVLQDVPKTLPALLRAYQIQARAARVGFDWPQSAQGIAQVRAKIDEELEELHQVLARTAGKESAPSSETGHASAGNAHEAMEAEFGDVLFSLVNYARHMKLNPEEALRQSTNRFAARFQFIEEQASGTGRAISELTLEEMDRYWEEAKAKEHPGSAPVSEPPGHKRSRGHE